VPVAVSVTVTEKPTLEREPRKTQKWPLIVRPSRTLTVSSRLSGSKNQKAPVSGVSGRLERPPAVPADPQRRVAVRLPEEIDAARIGGGEGHLLDAGRDPQPCHTTIAGAPGLARGIDRQQHVRIGRMRPQLLDGLAQPGDRDLGP